MSIFESIQNFITGDPDKPEFGLRTTFFSGLVFSVAGVGINFLAKALGEWLESE